MKKILRISLLIAILAGVMAYVLTPNDSILYFGYNEPDYGDLSSRSVDDPNRSDAPYLGMKTHVSSKVSVSKSGPNMLLNSAGSYVRNESYAPKRISQGSINGGGASIQFKSSPARSNSSVSVNGMGFTQFPSFTAQNEKKRPKLSDEDPIVETGTMQAVDIHGGGPSVGGNDPHYTPIGDAVLPLALFMLLFVACKRLLKAA